MDLGIDPNKYLQLTDDQPLEDLIEEIIDNEKGLGEEDDSHHVAVFIDDAVNWLNSSRKSLTSFRKLAMNGRHLLLEHSSIQTFLVTQKIKSVPLSLRSQANQIFTFDTTKNEKEILRDEFMGLDKNEAKLIFDHVFDKKHNFLFINLSMPRKCQLFKNFNQLTIVDEND